MTIREQLSEALDDGKFATFKRLLLAHPEERKNPNGTDAWLVDAVESGRLKFVEFLVSTGSDVNQGKYEILDDNPLVRAASKGHLEVVRWLLDHGATMKLYKGENTALCEAIQDGHLEVVKLLVERGADPNAYWYHERGEPFSPLKMALTWGHEHPEVANLLRSLGGRLPHEQLPWDLAAGHEIIVKRFAEDEKYDGIPVRLPDDGIDPPIAVYLIPPRPKRDWHTLFTVGMSDRMLALPETVGFGLQFAELKINLSRDWPGLLKAKALADPKISWPVHWLRRIARNPETTLVDGPFAHEQPPRPFASNTLLSSLFVTRHGMGSDFGCILPDHRLVYYFWLYAVYDEERTLGWNLNGLIQNKKLPCIVDLDRPSLGKRKPAPAPVKTLTVREVKKADLNLPADLVRYLKSKAPKRFKLKRSEVQLVPLNKLKIEVFEVGAWLTPYENEDPNEGSDGYYAVPGVHLTVDGPLLWLPLEGRYGAYDYEHNPMMMLNPEITWTEIMSDMATYIKAINSGGEPDLEYAEYLCPWPKYPFVEER
jgi:hypothetical protein